MASQGQISLDSIKRDIVSHLALSGGGSFGVVLVASNSISEYTNVVVKLSRLEVGNFVQECLAQLPQGSAIATTAVIIDKKMSLDHH